MKNSSIIVAILALIGCLAGTVLGAPDTYIGDAAIYSGLDTGTNRPRPNVLFIIDNSAATLNIASGVKYEPSFLYTNLGYDTYTVYAGDNQGNFTKVEMANATSALENISCNVAVVKTSLQQSGTYSGSGTASYPNLKAGACDTGPKGSTYALGNYLNYLQSNTAVDESLIVTAPYTYTARVTGKMVTVTEYRDFQVTVEHVSSETNKPGSTAEGATWEQYWTMLAGVSESTTTTWVVGKSYAAPTESGKTQREIVYDALSTVINGARYAVNFGAMTYGGNNHGGKIVSHMSDLSTATNIDSFMLPIPGPKDTSGNWLGEKVLSSATARPQSEALYDGGFYLEAVYPGTQQSIAETAQIPQTLRNPCGYNHIILITNGLSNGDGGSASSLGAIGDYDGDGWENEAVYGEGSHYLDDVAKYLKVNHGISTHTILAFQAADALVEGAAERGGGKFYNVYDANALAAALTKLLTSIVLEADTSFVAPVVPASSTNRTISSNRVYLGLFKPQNNRPWLGNLKKYGVSSDLTLLDKNGVAATDPYGDFLPNSKSFWGVVASGTDEGRIMSIDGLLPLAAGGVEGDGGNVAAGGVGGTLVLDLQAGLALATPKKAWETRNIYTWPSGSASTTLTHSDNRFSPNNTLITATTLALADATEKDKLINFVAGADGYDDNKDGNSSEIRDWVLGDILHSKPLIFSYSHYTEAQEGDCSLNTSMVYVGSNDGMFHAFRDCDGKEVWAFIPDNVLPNLQYLRESEHYYFSDAAPTAYVHDVDGDNIIDLADGDKVVLIFGQGRGGGRNTLDATGSRGGYYAIDVSNPLVPVLLWRIDSDTSGFAELGETWSPPRLAKVKVGATNVRKVVAFIGAGYDNNEDLRFGSNMLFPTATTNTTDTSLPTSDSGPVSSVGGGNPVNPRGRGVYAIEIATLTQGYGSCAGTSKYCPDFSTSGSKIWSFVHATGNGMDYSIPSDLTVLDMDGDTFQDRIYVGDLGGRIWRFDVSSSDTADWTTSARMIFKSNKDNETFTGRKIFYRPVVALTGGYPTLYFGTGDRSHPLNTAVKDRLFAVRDKGQTSPVDISSLVDVTANELQSTSDTTVISDTLDALASGYGWFIDLNQNAGEKVLASALLFNKEAFYTTYAPSSQDELDDDPCQVGNLGVSRVYQMNYTTGEATQNFQDDATQTASDNERSQGAGGAILLRADRVRTIGVGIPSGIVTLIDASGKVTLMISSSNRVGTYQAPDARMMTPLYWMQY